MTFDDLKSTILLASRKYGMCEEYHDVKLAIDYQSLIDATITLFLYGWQKGIANTDILDEFDATLLLNNGVYYNQTGTSATPTMPKAYFDGNDIYVIGGDPAITFSGNLKNRLTIVESNPTVNVNDNSYVRIEIYNSQALINVTGTVDTTIQNKAAQAVIMNVDGEASIFNDFNTDLTLNFGVDAYVKLFSEKNSLTTVNLDSTDLRIFALRTQKSIINFVAP